MIILVGPPGALAPEVAAELSARTGWEYGDTQGLIDSLATPEGIDSYTEENMRAIEHEVALAALGDLEPGAHRILALGSGCLGNSREDSQFADVRARLATLREGGAHVVHLTASLKVLSHRNGLDGPRLAAVASPRRIFFTQLSTRSPLYEAASDLTIDTSDRKAGEVALDVVGRVS
ncbi:MAG: shikimate kinase [Ancrocorticia sp.]|uniref:shikimate kinase n=1 Tax=Ancrocorticia sp. TaxID=2593684 RepID=UPI003F93E636